MTNPPVCGPVPPLFIPSPAHSLHLLADAAMQNIAVAGDETANPENTSPKRPRSPSTAALVEILVDLQLVKRRKSSTDMNTSYVDIKLTRAARKALEELMEGATPLALYNKLREPEDEETGKRRNSEAKKVLNGFGNFLRKQGKSFPAIMADFAVFAPMAAAYRKESGCANAPLHDLSARSFGELPLHGYITSKTNDRESLLSRLSRGEEAISFAKSHSYLIETHLAARGCHGAAELFREDGEQSAKERFFAIMNEVFEENPGNTNLKSFLSYLMADTFCSSLGTAVLNVIDSYKEECAKCRSHLKPRTVRMYEKIGIRLALFACMKSMPYDAFRALLKEPNDSAGLTAAMKWCATGDRAFRTTLGILRDRLPEDDPNSSRQSARNA